MCSMTAGAGPRKCLWGVRSEIILLTRRFCLWMFAGVLPRSSVHHKKRM